MRIATERLEQARAELQARLGEDPPARLLEPLGRVHRYEERQNGHRMARVGTLLWPWEESGSVDLSLFDWFEEAALIEAWLHEERQPGHAELLELLGG